MAVHERKHSPEPDEGTEFVDELQTGTQLMRGQYVIRDFLNAGGFGITYLATDSLDRTVVIKECFPGTFCRRSNVSVQPRSRAHQAELSSIVRLFANEAHSLARVGHPNIVGVHNVFEENNTAYMALDFVNGRDLLEIIEDPESSLTPEQIRTFLEKMLDAIGFVHRAGMLHRDISPDNIIIRKDGEPVLIDFGAAREQATKASRVLSALRVVKDGYSPQEFYITGSEQSPSCDLYSLAASFYHVITGELPPDSQKRLTAFASSEPDPYVPLGQRTDAFDATFCAALDKAMSVLPKERMQSAEDWLAAMRGDAVDTSEDAAPQPVVPVRPSPRGATPRPAADTAAKPKSGGTLKLVIGSTALVALAGGAYFVLTSPQGDVATKPAAVVAAATPAPRTPVEKAPAATVAAPVATVAPTPDPSPAERPGRETAVVQAPAPTPAPVATPAPEPSPAPVATAAPEPTSVPAEPAAVAEAPALKLAPFTAKPGMTIPAKQAEAALAAVEAEANPAEFFVSRPVLPFSAAPANPALIGDVMKGSPDWAAPGLQIVSLDGVEVASLEDAINRVGESLASDATSATLVLGIAGANGATVEHSLTVPVQHDLSLPNGLRFRTSLEDGIWVTRVTRTSAQTGFVDGDVIAANMSDNSLIDGPDSLMRVIQSGISGGTTKFTFAVRRGGELFVESFQLTAM